MRESKAYPGWSTPQGKDEHRVNLATGEVLGRREFGKTIGELFRSGFNSYEGRRDTLGKATVHTPDSGGTRTTYKMKGVVDPNKAAQYILDKTSHKANAQFNFNMKMRNPPSKPRIDKRTGKPKGGKDSGWRSSTSAGYASDINVAIQDFMSLYEVDESDIAEMEFNAYDE